VTALVPRTAIGDEIDLDEPPMHCGVLMELARVDEDGLHIFTCLRGDYELHADDGGIVADLRRRRPARRGPR
jgi:hypothetical protein